MVELTSNSVLRIVAVQDGAQACAGTPEVYCMDWQGVGLPGTEPDLLTLTDEVKRLQSDAGGQWPLIVSVENRADQEGGEELGHVLTVHANFLAGKSLADILSASLPT